MQKCEILQHPVITVEIGGTVVEKRPSEFRLITAAGLRTVDCRLWYPIGSDIGKAGDTISVSLVNDNQKDLYFTGEVYAAASYGDKYRQLLLIDGYKKLVTTCFTPAYRKEKAGVILDDILSAAGISEKDIVCPDVELARFSTENLPAHLCIEFLIGALSQHGAENLVWFFDAKNVFHFGTPDNKGKNEGGAERFESGKNIVRSGSDWIEALPRPIRHTQAVSVNGKEYITTGTQLIVSQKNTRLILKFKEAVNAARE